jgi:hypothetical protein
MGKGIKSLRHYLVTLTGNWCAFKFKSNDSYGLSFGHSSREQRKTSKDVLKVAKKSQIRVTDETSGMTGIMVIAIIYDIVVWAARCEDAYVN